MYFQCTHYSTGCINRWVPQSATGKPVLGKVVCKVSCDDGDVFVYPLCLLCFYFFYGACGFLFIYFCLLYQRGNNTNIWCTTWNKIARWAVDSLFFQSSVSHQIDVKNNLWYHPVSPITYNSMKLQWLVFSKKPKLPVSTNPSESQQIQWHSVWSGLLFCKLCNYCSLRWCSSSCPS